MKVLAVFVDAWPTNGGGHVFSSAIHQELLRSTTLLNKYTIISRSIHGKWMVNSHLCDYELDSLITLFHESSQLDFLFYFDSLPLTQNPEKIPYGCVVWDIGHRDYPELNEMTRVPLSEFRRREHQFNLIKSAALISVGSRLLKSSLCSKYGLGSERIVVNKLPVPLDGSTINQAPLLCDHQRAHEEPIFEPTIIYPSMFWGHKNHMVLLRAFDMIKKIAPFIKPHIILTGSEKDGGSYQAVNDYIQTMGFGSSIELKGFVDRESHIDILRRSDLMVYCSVLGPDNLPPLEAMSLGLPVIHSDFKWAREQLGKSALYFDYDSPYSLASQIIRLCLDSRLRRSLISKGLSLVCRRTTSSYVRKIDTSIFSLQSILDLNYGG